MTASPAASAKETILVVDDEASIRRIGRVSPLRPSWFG